MKAQQVDSPERRGMSLAKEINWLAAPRDRGRWANTNYSNDPQCLFYIAIVNF